MRVCRSLPFDSDIETFLSWKRSADFQPTYYTYLTHRLEPCRSIHLKRPTKSPPPPQYHHAVEVHPHGHGRHLGRRGLPFRQEAGDTSRWKRCHPFVLPGSFPRSFEHSGGVQLGDTHHHHGGKGRAGRGVQLPVQLFRIFILEQQLLLLVVDQWRGDFLRRQPERGHLLLHDVVDHPQQPVRNRVLGRCVGQRRRVRCLRQGHRPQRQLHHSHGEPPFLKPPIPFAI